MWNMKIFPLTVITVKSLAIGLRIVKEGKNQCLRKLNMLNILFLYNLLKKLMIQFLLKGLPQNNTLKLTMTKLGWMQTNC
jgi:hypothetical protein